MATDIQGSDLYGQAENGIQHPLAQPMIATPMDAHQIGQRDMAQQQVQDGRSTDMTAQTEHAIEQATRLADMMAARGATDEEIKRAVGSIAGVNTDNRAAVQAAAMNTADARKFSILGGAAKTDGQSQETTTTLAAVLGVAATPAVEKAVLDSPFVLSDEQRRNQPQTTEQALAAMGADIPKTPGLPMQQRAQNISR